MNYCLLSGMRTLLSALHPSIFFFGNSSLEDLMSVENSQDELARLRAENEALKKQQTAKRAELWLKVSEKGGLSVYGLGRFPVTLYVEQWERLLGFTDEIRQFIEENRNKLKTKE